MKNLHAKWVERYKADSEGLARLVRKDPFVRWEQNSSPDGVARDRLRWALDIAGGDGPRGDALIALNVARTVFQRAVAENRFAAGPGSQLFPLHFAGALAVNSYVAGLLDGVFLKDDLANAARSFVAFCEKYPAKWDSQPQGYLLSGVRTALIAGDLALATSVLKTKRSFKWHVEEHGLWQCLVDRNLSGNVLRGDLLARFDARFDVVRSPDYRADVVMDAGMVSWEMALIRSRYCESTSGQVDWWGAVGTLSA